MIYLNTSPRSIYNFFCIPALHWAGNNICAQVDLVKLGISLQYIPTPSPLRSKWIITKYDKKQNIN